MARRLVWRLPAGLVLVGLLGQVDCAGQSDDKGPDCASLCEKGMKECPTLPRVDCDSQCLYEDARANETGCGEHVRNVASCSASLEDICTSATACASELKGFWDCVNAWCGKHPGSTYCATPPED